MPEVATHVLELEYWIKTGIARGLEPYHMYLEEFRLAPWSLTGKRVLDVGCGYFGGMLSVLQGLAEGIGLDKLTGHYLAMGSTANLLAGFYLIGEANKSSPK